MTEKAPTAQEIEQLGRCVSFLDSSLMWTRQEGRGAKMVRLVLCILSSVLPISLLYVLFYLLSPLSGTMDPFSICALIISATALIAISSVLSFNYISEKKRARPPVFLLYSDVLYLIECRKDGTENEIAHLIERDAPSKKVAATIRRDVRHCHNKSKWEMYAQIFYVGAIIDTKEGKCDDRAREQATSGEDIDERASLLSIDKIDDITDVRLEDDGTEDERFVIEYEQEEQKMSVVLFMDEWSTLYEWLRAQMGKDQGSE